MAKQYIEEDTVISEICKTFEGHYHSEVYAPAEFVALIEELPAKKGELAIRCGDCCHAQNNRTVPCAYTCGNAKAPCHGRTTYADFGCLYGERSMEDGNS